MAEMHYKVEKEIPVLAETDVLVVGGGPGGMVLTKAPRGANIFLSIVDARAGRARGGRSVWVAGRARVGLLFFCAP